MAMTTSLTKTLIEEGSPVSILSSESELIQAVGMARYVNEVTKLFMELNEREPEIPSETARVAMIGIFKDCNYVVACKILDLL
jgi:hypothetical protein